MRNHSLTLKCWRLAIVLVSPAVVMDYLNNKCRGKDRKGHCLEIISSLPVAREIKNANDTWTQLAQYPKMQLTYGYCPVYAW